MKRLVFVLALLCSSTQAMAADPCTNLSKATLAINANGFTGTTSAIELSLPINGVYDFRTSVDFGGGPEEMTGKCKNRHIIFTRKIPTGPAQSYEGWIFEKTPLMMAGVFSYKNLKSYGWCGELTPGQ